MKDIQSNMSMSNLLSRWRLPERHVLFTLLVAGLLIMTQSVWSQPSATTTATSTSLISYQGRLADASGEPLSGQYDMELRLYDVPTGGTPLWEEYWTGSNSVEVSDGLFNVMLGSINNTLASAIAGHNELYLGITVGTDDEMSPRVQLGSVPFAMQAGDADTVDGLHASDFAADGHNHDDHYYTQNELQTDGSATVHWNNLSNIPIGFADGTDNVGLNGPIILEKQWSGSGCSYQEYLRVCIDTTCSNSVILSSGDNCGP